MKILLDECVTKRLKRHLEDFEVYTVREMGWGGIKNGKLMALCVENNFDLLLTIDKNLMFQQNLNKYSLTIVVINSLTSKVEELIEFLPSFKSQIDSFKSPKHILLTSSQANAQQKHCRNSGGQSYSQHYFTNHLQLSA